MMKIFVFEQRKFKTSRRENNGFHSTFKVRACVFSVRIKIVAHVFCYLFQAPFLLLFFCCFSLSLPLSILTYGHAVYSIRCLNNINITIGNTSNFNCSCATTVHNKRESLRNFQIIIITDLPLCVFLFVLL